MTAGKADGTPPSRGGAPGKRLRNFRPLGTNVEWLSLRVPWTKDAFQMLEPCEGKLLAKHI